MSRPAFIVDGFTEKLVIGSICPGSPISRTDLNGKSVTIQAIAIKVASLIRLFNNKYYPIIIIFDRENRNECCEELCSELLRLLINNGIVNQDIRICVADRMFENWIIADWDVLNSSEQKPEDTDGLKGSSVIKRILGSYHKTTQGVEMFFKANPSKVYKNSKSFKVLVDSISDIQCEYTRF